MLGLLAARPEVVSCCPAAVGVLAIPIPLRSSVTSSVRKLANSSRATGNSTSRTPRCCLRQCPPRTPKTAMPLRGGDPEDARGRSLSATCPRAGRSIWPPVWLTGGTGRGSGRHRHWSAVRGERPAGGRRIGEAEADVVVGVRRVVAIAVGRAAVLGVVVEAAAPDDPVGGTRYDPRPPLSLTQSSALFTSFRLRPRVAPRSRCAIRHSTERTRSSSVILPRRYSW